MTLPYSPFNRFHHVVVAVDDPDAAAADWTRIFGVPALPGQRVGIGDTWVEFVAADGGPSGVVRVGVEVDNDTALAARALAAGAPVTYAGATVVELSGVHIEMCAGDNALTPPSNTRSITGIHHVVVAVRDDDEATAAWNHTFGFTPSPEGPDGVLVSHHVPVGNAWFGLTAAGTDANAVSSFVERRGEGVYALALAVQNRTEFVASVADAGGRVLGDPGDFQVFVHPATTHGVLVEVIEV